MVLKVPLVHREHKVCKECRAPEEQMEIMVYRVRLVFKEFPAPLALQDLMVVEGNKDSKESKVSKEFKAFLVIKEHRV